jgi:hypothetical protein
MNWFQKNFKTLIYCAFLVPILTVAVVSISHVTKWYGISNPFSWAIYLSVGIEIAALSALAAISASMGKKVYFPFAIVTLIQFIGNIFFAYQYIDINSQTFKDWIDLVNPVVSFLGVDSGDPIGHKRFLALFAGGMLPLISLSFLHMLVKFEEEDKKKQPEIQPVIDIDSLSIEAGKKEAELEKEKWTPTEEDLNKIAEILLNSPKPIENLKDTKEEYDKEINDEMYDSEGYLISNSSNWTEEMEERYWDEQVIEPFATPEELEQTEEPKINRLVYTRRDG